MATTEAKEGRRAEDLGFASVPLELCAELGEYRRGPGRVAPRDDDAEQVTEGRVAELTPPLELSREELAHVMASREGDGTRVRLIGLDEHAARSLPPAPSRELGHQLECPLFGPEVGHGHAGVRIDDGGERDAFEVVALGDHLRAEEHRFLRGGKASQRLGEHGGLRHRVGVEPEALELGNVLLELRLQPLGTCAEASEVWREADRAERGLRLPSPAVVAVE